MRSIAIFAILGVSLFAIDRAIEQASPRIAPHHEESSASPSFDGTPEGDIRLLAAAARRAGLDRADSVVRSRLVRNLRFLGREGSDMALYREALALGMDRSDVVIERRLADRMAAQWRAEALREPPAEAELRRWYWKHRDRFWRPPAVAFRQVFVSRERHGESTDGRARALLASLRAASAGLRAATTRSDASPLPADVPLRGIPELARQFGPAFADAVANLAIGGWSDPIPSSYGLHLVWVHERRAGYHPSFDEVRPQVEDGWREERGDAELGEALARLRASGGG